MLEMAELGGRYKLYDSVKVEWFDSTTHWIQSDAIINTEDAR